MTSGGGECMRLNNFTAEAQEAMTQAEHLAARYHHAQLDVEHFLVALTEKQDGIVQSVCDRLGVSRDAVRAELDIVLRSRPTVDAAVDIYISSALRHTIRDAVEVARQRHDDCVDIEHLLLASVEQNKCEAADIAAKLGLTRKAIADALHTPQDSA